MLQNLLKILILISLAAPAISQSPSVLPPPRLPLIIGDLDADPITDMPAALPSLKLDINTRRADVLTNAVINCYPNKSSWGVEVSAEARATKRQKDYQGETTLISSQDQSGISIVAKIPLFSAVELDRERQREYQRRQDVAAAVAKFFGAMADIKVAKRERQLMSALEARSARRVQIGVTATDEQVGYLEKNVKAINNISKAEADILEARLKLISMCAPEYSGMVEALINEAQFQR